MKIVQSIEEFPHKEYDSVNVLTWFRPSAWPDGWDHTEFTLGHLVQTTQLENISASLIKAKKNHKIFVILADIQWFLDNPTKDYSEKIKKYTDSYMDNAFSILSDIPNVHIFKESDVYDIIQKISSCLGTYLPYDYLSKDIIKERNTSILNKFWKKISHERLKADFLDQAAHAVWANAVLIPWWANQMRPFELAEQALRNFEEAWFTYDYNKKLYWSVDWGYLVWLDGEKMSTSKGNAIWVMSHLNSLEDELNARDDIWAFIKSYSEIFWTNDQKEEVMNHMLEKLWKIQKRVSSKQQKEQHLAEAAKVYRESAEQVLQSLRVF